MVLVAFTSRLLKLKKVPLKGPDVLEVQERLQERGFYGEKPDGIFDEKTQAALKSFQKAYGLTPDGVVGSETWRQLYKEEKVFKVLASQEEIIIDINRRVLIFNSPHFTKIYPVAVGKASTPTPLGNWRIVQKAVDPGGPFGVRWMRLSVPFGGYGVHGTNNPKSIGRAVSNGCVRLYNEDVIEVYNRTPIGTPVTIIGKAYANRILQLGTEGTDVEEVQRMLRRLGYYRGKLDGSFGPFTENAVKAFQTSRNLNPDGIVGPNTLTALQQAYAAR
jgi:L,D-transpeptidase ErfK/SrfK